MNECFRNRVIYVGQSMYVKYSESGDIELTGDLLNAHFFYNKDNCEEVARSLIEKFPNTEIEVLKLFTKVEIQEKIIIQ